MSVGIVNTESGPWRMGNSRASDMASPQHDDQEHKYGLVLN